LSALETFVCGILLGLSLRQRAVARSDDAPQFQGAEREKGRLRTFFVLSVPCRFVGSDGQVRRAVSEPVRSPYILALSRAGLSDAATQALLYVEETWGPGGAAEGYFVLVARLGGVWRTQQRVPVWIS
jgi:hypothetical protein